VDHRASYAVVRACWPRPAGAPPAVRCGPAASCRALRAEAVPSKRSDAPQDDHVATALKPRRGRRGPDTPAGKDRHTAGQAPGGAEAPHPHPVFQQSDPFLDLPRLWSDGVMRHQAHYAEPDTRTVQGYCPWRRLPSRRSDRSRFPARASSAARRSEGWRDRSSSRRPSPS
jgi:hypothetical protein